jgi:hypothetical protein
MTCVTSICPFVVCNFFLLQKLSAPLRLLRILWLCENLGMFTHYGMSGGANLTYFSSIIYLTFAMCLCWKYELWLCESLHILDARLRINYWRTSSGRKLKRSGCSGFSFFCHCMHDLQKWCLSVDLGSHFTSSKWFSPPKSFPGADCWMPFPLLLLATADPKLKDQWSAEHYCSVR